MKKTQLLFFALMIFVLTACGNNTGSQDHEVIESVPSPYADLTNPFDEDAAPEGAKIFHTYCETCHGVEGHGNGPASQALDPKPKNLAELQTVVADDYLFWRITEGKPGTSMPAWQGIMTEEQIWQVVAFIQTLE